jgi:UDP-glucose 4-epimerase
MSIIIFGGTGTLGRALSKIASRHHYDVVIVSRDELKQQQMKKDHPEFTYVLGDVSTTYWQQDIPFKNYKYAFNLAAVKHVDVAEVAVSQCFRVNTIGTQNTAQWALETGVDHYCLSSTDKSVLPINAYGFSKGLAEKLISAMNGRASTEFKTFRWGNVAMSRGSVIHAFVDSLKERGAVSITHREMSRFWAHIDDVAEFMWDRKDAPGREEAYIPPMKASTVLELADAVANVLGIADYNIEITGIRPGEKIHECLRSGHDYCITSKNCEQYDKDELRELVRRSLCHAQ